MSASPSKHNPVAVAFGKALRTARNQIGSSQEAFAERADAAQGHPGRAKMWRVKTHHWVVAAGDNRERAQPGTNRAQAAELCRPYATVNRVRQRTRTRGLRWVAH
jgi:hypothetical protein